MPVISTFFGIVVRMYYREHEPAHFHAEYQGQHAIMDMNGHVMRGDLKSRTAHRLLEEWAGQHRTELEQNWELMKQGRPLSRIEPLSWGRK